MAPNPFPPSPAWCRPSTWEWPPDACWAVAHSGWRATGAWALPPSTSSPSTAWPNWWAPPPWPPPVAGRCPRRSWPSPYGPSWPPVRACSVRWPPRRHRGGAGGAYRELRDPSPAALAAVSAHSSRADDLVRICGAAAERLAPGWYDEVDRAGAAASVLDSGGGPPGGLGAAVVYLPQRVTRPTLAATPAPPVGGPQGVGGHLIGGQYRAVDPPRSTWFGNDLGTRRRHGARETRGLRRT